MPLTLAAGPCAAVGERFVGLEAAPVGAIGAGAGPWSSDLAALIRRETHSKVEWRIVCLVHVKSSENVGMEFFGY